MGGLEIIIILVALVFLIRYFYQLGKNAANSGSGSGAAPQTRTFMYQRPFSDVEINQMLEWVNFQFYIWKGPAYYHYDMLIAFESDKIRFQAIDAGLNNFSAGWNYSYPRPIADSQTWNEFRKEMASKTYSMLTANYPADTKLLYFDGYDVLLRTNGLYYDKLQNYLNEHWQELL